MTAVEVHICSPPLFLRCCTSHVDACDLLPCCVYCPLGQKCGANIAGTFCTLPVRDHANPFSTNPADHQCGHDEGKKAPK